MHIRGATMNPRSIRFQVDEGDKPLSFTQVFTLAPSPETPEQPFFMCVTDTADSVP